MEDDGTGEAGRYNVQFVSTDCVKDWVEGRHEAQVSVVRLLHCGSFPGIDSLQTLLENVLVEVTAGCWKGLIKNVPGRLSDLPITVEDDVQVNDDESIDCGGYGQGIVSSLAERIASRYCIAVTTRYAKTPAPILVLVSLRYKGNIGCIVRSAVQANFFEAIYIIDPEHQEGGRNARIGDAQISYYSMMNAPLIPIRRFASTSEFLGAVEREGGDSRIRIATALSDKAMNIYTSEASAFLGQNSSYIFMGEENCGLPAELLRCSVHLRIPSLSASINVSNAFSVVLTCMLMASAGERA